MMREIQVALLPGSEFLRPAHELTVRLCYVDFDGTSAMQALERGETLDQDFMHAYMGNLVKGIAMLKQFVKKYSGN